MALSSFSISSAWSLLIPSGILTVTESALTGWGFSERGWAVCAKAEIDNPLKIRKANRNRRRIFSSLCLQGELVEPTRRAWVTLNLTSVLLPQCRDLVDREHR